MPKQKTHKGVKKRFRITAKGKVKHRRAGTSHLQVRLTSKRKRKLRGTGVLANSVCPGWVRTEMGGADAPRTVAQGADTAVWLATLPGDGPSGGFFRDRMQIPW